MGLVVGSKGTQEEGVSIEDCLEMFKEGLGHGGLGEF